MLPGFVAVLSLQNRWWLPLLFFLASVGLFQFGSLLVSGDFYPTMAVLPSLGGNKPGLLVGFDPFLQNSLSFCLLLLKHICFIMKETNLWTPSWIWRLKTLLTKLPAVRIISSKGAIVDMGHKCQLKMKERRKKWNRDNSSFLIAPSRDNSGRLMGRDC